MIVNGKEYPMWSQFVERKKEWIGGVLVEFDSGEVHKTKITDITLTPNGEESAKFCVEGEDFGCGFGVEYGGVIGGEAGWVTFEGYQGHTWRIKKKCPTTITGMVNALRRKYPDNPLVAIDKGYSDYLVESDIEISYNLYIDNVECKTKLTWQELKDLVAEHLK
jgi:hypothetical protein